MADEVLSDSVASSPALARQPVRRGSGRAILGTALLAFVIGGAAVGYAAWHGLVPGQKAEPAALVVPADIALPTAPQMDRQTLAARQGGLEARLAVLEQRLDAIHVRAGAAAGNAARAEALLIAAAARRAIDRGVPLGYLEDQLRLRFGSSQPGAVATVLEASRAPTTLDQLLAGLDSLAPALTAAPGEESTWRRVQREVAGLFVFRRQTTPSPAPQLVLQRARLLLEAGRTEEAISALQRLPGADEARDWFVAARRYGAVHRALDVLETAALLDTRALRNSEGTTLDEVDAQEASPPAATGAQSAQNAPAAPGA